MPTGVLANVSFVRTSCFIFLVKPFTEWLKSRIPCSVLESFCFFMARLHVRAKFPTPSRSLFLFLNFCITCKVRAEFPAPFGVFCLKIFCFTCQVKGPNSLLHLESLLIAEFPVFCWGDRFPPWAISLFFLLFLLIPDKENSDIVRIK